MAYLYESWQADGKGQALLASARSDDPGWTSGDDWVNAQKGQKTCVLITRTRAGKSATIVKIWQRPGYIDPCDEGSDLNRLPAATLAEIAKVVRNDWKNINYGARPYLNAMSRLSSLNDKYGLEDGRSIVLYFLANAGTWRGPTARAVKAELRSRLGEMPR